MAYTGSSSSFGGKRVDTVSASFSLTPNESGKVFILSGAAVTVTLPSLSDINPGYSFTLISGDDSEHVLSGGASKIYGYSVNETSETAATQVTQLAGASSVTLVTAAIGDKMDVVSDGTNWYVYTISNTGVS